MKFSQKTAPLKWKVAFDPSHIFLFPLMHAKRHARKTFLEFFNGFLTYLFTLFGILLPLNPDP